MELSKKMCDWEAQKAAFIMGEAAKMGMSINGYGMANVNPNSGYTYLWLEDYDFTLYMPINCDLIKSDIVALWTNPNDGEEIEYNLTSRTTLKQLENWAYRLSKKAG